MHDPAPSSTRSDARLRIALWILVLATIGLFVISALMLVGAARQSAEVFTDTSRELLFAVLPLLGTWVGTVLAFYFSKDNFEAASESVRATFKEAQAERLKAALIRDQMIPAASVIKVVWNDADDPSKKLGADVITVLKNGKVSRLAVLKADNAGRGVIHESLIYRFTSDKLEEAAAASGQAPAADDFTFDDLLKHPFRNSTTIGNIMEQSVAYVRMDGTLADAKRKMDDRSKGSTVECRDIFITENGRDDETVLGYLTDTMIEKFTEAG